MSWSAVSHHSLGGVAGRLKVWQGTHGLASWASNGFTSDSISMLASTRYLGHTATPNDSTELGNEEEAKLSEAEAGSRLRRR